MGSIRSSVDSAALNAWRGLLAATGTRRGLRTQLLHHRQELLPRFATLYRQLRALPRRLRKALQRRWGVSLASAALLLTLQPLSGEAATFTASTAADLTAALNEANSNGTTNTITLTADITLLAVDNAAFSSPNGLPVITSSITIAGQGHTIHRDSGAPEFRLLAVSNTGDLTLQDTTLSGGRSSVSSYNCRYYGARCYGGGILNTGRLMLTNSTVAGNTGGFGGGISNRDYGTSPSLTLTNSTVADNAAPLGGGIFNYRGSLSLTNSTVSGNSAESGGGIGIFYGSLTLSRSLVSGNTAPTAAEVSVTSLSSFTATFTLLGHNGLTTAKALAGFTPDPSDLIATSDGNKPTALAAILDTTLQNNGGPTRTHNLVTDSPAVDAAGANCGLTEDQRGAPRPVDGDGNGVAACDIGAVEFGSVPSPLDCSTATASVDFPRLGNRHRYPVTIQGVTAPPGDTVSLTINSIFQDEPVVNPTGKTCPDGIGVGTAVAKVRNERLLASDGRVYHIGFTATDNEGASCTGEVKVCVPVTEGEECRDQGALFDSTTCP